MLIGTLAFHMKKERVISLKYDAETEEDMQSIIKELKRIEYKN